MKKVILLMFFCSMVWSATFYRVETKEKEVYIVNELEWTTGECLLSKGRVICNIESIKELPTLDLR